MNTQNMTPPLTDKSHENKLIALALRQTEKQLGNGTASSQIVTHFLRLSSVKAQVELEKLRLENRLLEARIEGEQQGQKLTEMMGEVLEALKSYSHVTPGDVDANLF